MHEHEHEVQARIDKEREAERAAGGIANARRLSGAR
jgi:hypothetical protein